MEYETLKKLANNPHYKMTEAQRRKWEEYNKMPMRAFPDIHPNEVPRHPVEVTTHNNGRKK